MTHCTHIPQTDTPASILGSARHAVFEVGQQYVLGWVQFFHTPQVLALIGEFCRREEKNENRCIK